MQKTTTLKGIAVFWLKSFLATLVLVLVFQSSFAQKQQAAAAVKSTATPAAKKQAVDPGIIAASKEKERQKLAGQNSAAPSAAFSDAVKDDAAVKVQTEAARAKQKGVAPVAAPAKASIPKKLALRAAAKAKSN
jgi:hypothetical protein